MKIGLISDTHIPDRGANLSESVKNAFKDVELILHAGDLTDNSIIEELEEIAPTIAVAGNMDRRNNSKLPQAQIIQVEIPKKEKIIKIGLIHGEVYPRGETQQLYYTAMELGVDILVSGHSHVPQLETVQKVILINPGSPTAPRLSDPSVAILEIKTENEAEDEEDINIKFIKVGAPVCSALNYFSNKSKKENKDD